MTTDLLGKEQPPCAGRVLIVDADYALRRTLHITLYEQGFDVSEAGCGDDGLAVARILKFDAVLLDRNMPGRNGIEICRDMRRLFPRLAIVMVSGCNDADDSVEALDAGADDYVVKPFHMRELIARIRAAVRRVQAPAAEIDVAVSVGSISLFPVRRQVRKAGASIHLTPKEFDLLHCLMRHSGIPLSHGRLLSSVWGNEFSRQVEYLRTFVRQLRRKLEDDPADPKYILTASHIGYRFADRTT